MAFSPRLNQALFIQVPETQNRAPTRILSYTELREVVLAVPMREEVEMILEPGTGVALDVFREDSVLRYTATVLDRRDKPPSLRVSWPDEEERIQRREAVRVPVEFLVWIAVYLPNGRTAPSIKTNCVDLSAGGLRVVSPELIPYPSDVELTLTLPDGAKHVVEGEVVRSGELQAPHHGHPYWSGVRFLKMSAALQRDVAKLVMDVQRELLKRG